MDYVNYVRERRDACVVMKLNGKYIFNIEEAAVPWKYLFHDISPTFLKEEILKKLPMELCMDIAQDVKVHNVWLAYELKKSFMTWRHKIHLVNCEFKRYISAVVQGDAPHAKELYWVFAEIYFIENAKFINSFWYYRSLGVSKREVGLFLEKSYHNEYVFEALGCKAVFEDQAKVLEPLVMSFETAYQRYSILRRAFHLNALEAFRQFSDSIE